jgi:hypothetical protein
MKDGTRRHTYLGVFLVSLAALSFEVALSRLFSIAISYHFAFMVVSLALLGYGASGSLLVLFPSLLQKNPERFLSCSAMLFSVSCVVSYTAANQIPFDPVRISWDRLQLIYLFSEYLLLSVPFFFSGLCISGALTHFATNAGRIYCSDLAGAGTGSLLVLVLFLPFGGKGVVILPAMVAALGALAFGLRRSSQRWTLVPVSVLLAFLVFLLWARPSILEVRMSPYKGLKRALWYPDSKILDTQWNAFSRVDVVESPLVRFAPGLSLTFQKPLPPQLGITIDGDNMTAITRFDGREAPVAFIFHLPDALAYRIAERDRVLVIEPGGGLGVLLALVMGAKEIEAVFDNPLVFQMVFSRYGKFAGNILKNPQVSAIIEKGRSFLRRTKRPYDVIQYSPLGNLEASSTGIRGLQESYLFTVEAMMDVFDHLESEGVFLMTQYLLPPPRQEVRLAHLALEALMTKEIREPERHLAMIRTWGTFTLLMKRTPFSEDEIRRLQEFCKEERFDPVYFPGMTKGQANRYNRFSRPIYYEMVQDLVSEADRKRLVEEYLFDLSPVTDDNPFFFNFFRFKKMAPLYRAMHEKWQPFLEGGYLVPLVLIQSVLASALLILLPLVFRRREVFPGRTRFRRWTLVYFALLGWGYMFVEIVLIQKLILFLDHPVYAMATVIFGLLMSSGIGSFLSQRMASRRLRRSLVVILVTISLLIWAYLRIIPFVVSHFLGFGLGYREAIILIVLLPLGVLMGMPFPLGIRFLKQVDPNTIPWAWCANGCFSVMGSVLSVVLALGIGFSGVLVLAGAVYLAGGGVVSISFLNLTNHGDEADAPKMANP